MRKLLITVSTVALSFSSVCCAPSWASYDAVKQMDEEWNAVEDLHTPSWAVEEDRKRKLEDLEAGDELAVSSQTNPLTQQPAAKASRADERKFTYLVRGSTPLLVDNFPDLLSIEGHTCLDNASRSSASKRVLEATDPLLETAPVDFFESVGFNDFNFAEAGTDEYKHRFYRVIEMAEAYEDQSQIGFHDTIKKAFPDHKLYNAERDKYIVCQFEIAEFFCNMPNLAETNPLELQKLLYNLNSVAKRLDFTAQQRSNACLAIANLAEKKLIPRLAGQTTDELYVIHCNRLALDYLKHAKGLGSGVAAYRAAELIARLKRVGNSIQASIQECLTLYSFAAKEGIQDAHYKIAHECVCLGDSQASQLHDTILPIVSPTATYLLQNNDTAEGAYRLAQLYRMHLVPKALVPINPKPYKTGVPKASIGTSTAEPKPLYDGSDQGYALKYFLKAANLGHMPAASMAYTMLSGGTGCMPNPPEAKKMLRIAAELGDISAKWDLVSMIYKDLNRSREDQHVAIKFLEELSALNDARTHASNLYLARIYRHNVESSSRIYTTENKRFQAIILKTIHYYFKFASSSLVRGRSAHRGRLEDAMQAFRPFLEHYQDFMTDTQQEFFALSNKIFDKKFRHPEWQELSKAAIDQLDPILLDQVGRQLKSNMANATVEQLEPLLLDQVDGATNTKIEEK